MIRIKHLLMIFLFFLGFSLFAEAESVEKKDRATRAREGYQFIGEARFQEIFKKYICKRLGKKGSDVIISRFKTVGNRALRPGKIRIRLFQKSPGRLEGYVKLAAIISVDGVVRNEVKLYGLVDLFESVVCTSRYLQRGEILKKEDAYLARKNLSHLSPKIFTDISKVIGLRAKHNIKEETCLKEWMLERPPVVDRGDRVTILAESDSLRVTVPGKALEKGYLNELIRIQNSMSKKEIYARVINPSTVLVDF